MKNSPKLHYGVLFHLLWLIQPLILWGLGTCQFQRGNPITLDSLGVRFCFWVAGVYVLLIGPIIHFAYPDIKKIRIKALRELALFGFLALPLLSFGYYVSHVTHTGALFDLIFPTLSLVLVSVHLFEANQNLSLLVIGLSTNLYLQWFFLSDILGPFDTAYRMIPTSDFFYWAKICGIVLAVGMALGATQRQGRRLSEKESVRHRVVTLMTWMFVGVVLYFAIPWVVSFYERDARLTFSIFDFLFCLIPFYLLLEVKPTFSRTRLGMWFRRGLAILFLARAISIICIEQATFVNISWVAFDLLTVFLLGLRLDSVNKPRESSSFS